VSADIEPTADLASAGLVARTLDGDAGISVHAHGPCANCGIALQGEYCHRCGQFSPPKSTVSEFIDDVQRDTALDQRFGALSHAIDHAQDNPDLALYKLKGAASKLSFLLVSIALPFLWLMFFWRKDVLLYDHVIFALYSISFMSLWIVLVEPVSSVKALAGLVPFLLLVPFLHVFIQLKETYQLGIAAAGWRTSALGFATTLAGVFYFLLVLLVTFH
jgi:hypothetical protein